MALVDTDLQRSSSIWMQRANTDIPFFAFQDAKQFIKEVARYAANQILQGRRRKSCCDKDFAL